MNLEELRDEVSYLVNFNPGQVDQDFRGPATNVNKRIDNALNQAYRREIEKAKTEGKRAYFRVTFQFTWPASTSTLTIPEQLQGKDIEMLRDDTNVTTTPGVPINVYEGVTDGVGISIEDYKTWRWYPAPDNARTVTAIYVARAEKMTEKTDTPYLIPDAHHDLLVWSAGIILRQIADEEAPQEWVSARRELRQAFWKETSHGKMRLFPGSRIRNNNPDLNAFF